MDIVSKFSEYRSTFPDMETIPTKEKQKAPYNLAICQAIYSTYLKNETAILSSYSDFYSKLRLYGAGRQPEEWYKTFLSGYGSGGTEAGSSLDIDGYGISNKDFQKKGWMNVDWTIRSLMPKIKSMLLPIIKNIDYDLKVDIIDRFHGAEEEDAMNRVAARTDFGEIIDQMKQQYQLPVPSDEMLPENWEDLQRMKEEGFFKPEHAMNTEKILRHTENISYWDETLYEDLIDDAIDLGIIAAEEVFDPEIGKSKWEYVNPAQLILQFSDQNDFRDSEFAGVVKSFTVSQLRQKYPEIEERIWRELAETYQGYRGNKKINDWGDTTTSYGYKYDDYKVATLKCYWIDVEKDKKVKYKSKKGNDSYYDYTKKTDKILKKNSNTSLMVTRKRIVYNALWVIGTEMVFDYGKMHNQARPNKTKPMIPIFAYRFSYDSITKRLKPVMDQLQIASLLYQNALSTASAGGFAIDVGMIDNITDGDKKYSIEGILQMWQERKILLHQTSLDGKYPGGATVPIQNVQGNLLQEIQSYISIMENAMQQVEHYTGISPVVLGATPAGDQGLGTTKMSYQSTMNSMKHIVDANKYIKQMLGASTMERMRIVMKADKGVKDAYEMVIGKTGVDSILTAKKRDIQYGMKLKARATDEEVQAIMQKAAESSAKRAQGQAGLNDGQYIEIIEMMKSGSSLQQTARRMQYFISKDEERIQQMQAQNIEKQNEGLKELEQIKGQNAEKQSQMGTQAEIQINAAKSEEERKTLTLEYRLKEKIERMKLMQSSASDKEKNTLQGQKNALQGQKNVMEAQIKQKEVTVSNED